MNQKTVLTAYQREQFEEELITQFQIYFKFVYDGDKAGLIEIYRQGRDTDKTGLWDRIGKAVNISGQKAYKYYTNTWSRMQQPKWSKDMKNAFKNLLTERVKKEYDKTLDAAAQRTAILRSFVVDMQIKEKYPNYHFDSLYFYLYNVITSTMSRLGADMHDIESIYAENEQSGVRRTKRRLLDQRAPRTGRDEREQGQRLPVLCTAQYGYRYIERPGLTYQLNPQFQVATIPQVNLELSEMDQRTINQQRVAFVDALVADSPYRTLITSLLEAQPPKENLSVSLSNFLNSPDSLYLLRSLGALTRQERPDIQTIANTDENLIRYQMLSDNEYQCIMNHCYQQNAEQSPSGKSDAHQM